MADTGIEWAAYAAVAKSGGGDWTALDIADNGNAGSGAIDLTGPYAAVQFGIGLAEDDTGAIDGDVTVAILRDCDGTNYEDAPAAGGTQVGAPYKFTIRPTRNDTTYVAFAIDPAQFGGSIKLWILNESGQTLTTTVKMQTATVPAAA